MSLPVIFYLREELTAAMLLPIDTGKQHTRAVQREQSPDAVELAREYLKHDESERELPQCRSNICTLKGSLRGSYVA